MKPSTKIETANAILAAINVMSRRFDVSEPEEWHRIEIAYDDLIAILEDLGFEQDIDFGNDGSGNLVLF